MVVPVEIVQVEECLNVERVHVVLVVVKGRESELVVKRGEGRATARRQWRGVGGRDVPLKPCASQRR